MAPVSRDDLTMTVLLIGEASGVFAGFCPSWFTVSSPFFHDQTAKEGNVKRIRWGEAAASAIVVGTGFAVAARSRSWFNLWASAFISFVFVAGYEYMIAHPSKEEGASTSLLPEPPDSDAGLGIRARGTL